jgi:DNA-binding transcriptional LysR family regulator
VCIRSLRSEPRIVLAARTHPLARRPQLSIAEVLDEVFCGMHPELEPVRAGFWQLDDHRGGPGHVTEDGAASAQEMVAIVASGRAIGTAPSSTATTFLAAVPNVVAIPLRDAKHTELALVWHKDCHNPLVDDIVAVAKKIAHGHR